MPDGDIRSVARQLGAYGRGNDRIVAHITPREAAILCMLGGSGTKNPDTGLIEFDDSGNATAPIAAPTYSPAKNVAPTFAQPNTGIFTPQSFAGPASPWQGPSQISSEFVDQALGGLPATDINVVNSGATIPGYVANEFSAVNQANPGAALASFNLNGQTDYGILGGTSDFQPIGVPYAPSVNQSYLYNDYMQPALPGLGVGQGNAAGYTFSPTGAVPTQAEVDQSSAVNRAAHKPFDFMIPLEALGFPLAVGAGAGALGFGAATGIGTEAAALSGIPGVAATAADAGGSLGALSELTGIPGGASPFAGDAALVGGDAAALPGSFGALNDAAGVDALSGGASAFADAGGGSALAGDTGSLAGAPSALGDLGGATDTAFFTTPDIGGGFSAPSGNVFLGATASTPADALPSAASGAEWINAAGVQPLGDLTASEFAAGGATTGIPAADAAGAGGGVGGFLKDVFDSTGLTDVSSALGLKPAQLLGLAASGVGLARSLTSGSTNAGPNSSITGVPQLNQQAAQLAQQGNVLAGYLQNGTLPPAVQQAVDAATHDAITAMKAKYAQHGIAPGSTMEQQEINRIKQQAVINGAQLADQLLQQGITETQLSADIYKSLANTDVQLSNATGQAIANLAAALSGGHTLKLVA